MKKIAFAGLALASLVACTSTASTQTAAPTKANPKQICIIHNPLVYQANFEKRILKAYQKLKVPARIVEQADNVCQTTLTYTARIDRRNNLVYRAKLKLMRQDTKLADITYDYKNDFDNIQAQVDYMVKATLYKKP